jgi:pimeloyl-ACP methyl ester carboxylesterase
MAFIDILWRGRTVSIEHAWVGVADASAPLVVFLHEGLGSLSMWKDFPQSLCHAAQVRGLVYSRPGYGQSTPRGDGEAWGVDFLHTQALHVLPALLKALGINTQRDKPWLLGHSDGGSIALIHAAHHPSTVAGVIAMAPHIMVEDISVQSISRARRAYVDGDLRGKLARHHANPDSPFWGWNDVWLSPAFRTWSIQQDLHRIVCPVLAIQGFDDPYGTMQQIEGITQHAAQAQCLKLRTCGHAPHVEQTAAVLQACTAFLSVVDRHPLVRHSSTAPGASLD